MNYEVLKVFPIHQITKDNSPNVKCNRITIGLTPYQRMDDVIELNEDLEILHKLRYHIRRLK